MIIEQHNGILVLRDDLLLGGTKSIFIQQLLNPTAKQFVYASPVYGGFQIALSAICQHIGKKAIIFCAKRKNPHANTLRCEQLGAEIHQVNAGYLSVVTAKAKEYCRLVPDSELLPFGANSELAINAIATRCRLLIATIGVEPDTIVCAVGSGTLLQGILRGTTTSKVIGVQVGKECSVAHPRFTRYVYPKPFEKESSCNSPFPSCSNYDLKAWEVLNDLQPIPGVTVFWNVM
ncbi:Pyridoxal-phosphate dependent enzyme [Chitinophaga jiangningensis]|uniref:Pyridoxal-phosphate dependent enzyme n=1 Tax=Chitinophaga jiangningensis TaxID=1419482 RepID=A0A1M6WHS0_9BACT|nr:pyridoxal-phosphate dependent enzyme [Chitinophaga jiangningensis]SHK93238.1 Pyridoxal-phosphate dependent enzyme [Chitinophaga jiangningensis]